MKHLKCHQSRSVGRYGATLSEVLISLLVMSIGVIALATLFPISVLRSVQATQLTNATNLRFNVEGLVNALPQIYAVGSSWQPSTIYAVNAVVTPSQYASLKYPPLVGICQVGGKSGILEPNWLNFNAGGHLITDNAVTWLIVPLGNYVVDPQGEYVQTYDAPNELLRLTNSGLHAFGNSNNSGYAAFSSSTLAFSGVNFVSTTPGTPSPFDDYQAANLAYLPDSWVLQQESNAITYAQGSTSCTLNDVKADLTTTTITAPTLGGAAGSAPAAYAPSRIVFYDITGNFSHVRPIITITGAVPTQTIDWTSPNAAVVPSTGPLPAGFTPVRARVESTERRYSWMLSVRRGMSGTSAMDVVVFFRRQFSPNDEIVYPATFQTGPIDPVNSVAASNIWNYLPADPGYDGAPGNWNIDDDNDGVTDNTSELGWPGSDDVVRNWVVIQYNPNAVFPLPTKPYYKKGGFVCDATNLRWYRITDVVEGDTPAHVMTKAGIPTAARNPALLPTYTPDTAIAGFNSALLRLERPIAQSGSVPTGGIAGGGTPTGGAIMMRGIIEVYPLPTQLSVDN